MIVREKLCIGIQCSVFSVYVPNLRIYLSTEQQEFELMNSSARDFMSLNDDNHSRILMVVFSQRNKATIPTRIEQNYLPVWNWCGGIIPSKLFSCQMAWMLTHNCHSLFSPFWFRNAELPISLYEYIYTVYIQRSRRRDLSFKTTQSSSKFVRAKHTHFCSIKPNYCSEMPFMNILSVIYVNKNETWNLVLCLNFFLFTISYI